MKTKIIATLMALTMVATAFALIVPTVSAQPSHLWVTSSDGGATGNIANAVDATTPTDALGRHYIQTRPGEVILGATAPNPPTSHDRCGPAGTSGTANMAQIDSEGFTTPSANADPTIFIAERDTTAALTALFPVSVQISLMAGGNIPNGYVASAPTYSFLWAEPLGYGCFGASQMTKIPSPTVTATQVSWTPIAGVPHIYGYGILQSTTSSGPWTELGQSTTSPYACVPVSNDWYSLVIYWAGTGAGFGNTQAVRGAVFGAPTLYGAPPTNVNAVVTGFAAEVGPLLAGNHLNQQVTLQATVSDAANEGNLIVGAEVSVDGGAWAAMTAVDGAFDEVTEDVTYVFTHGFGYYATGVHNYQVRAWDNGAPQGPITPASDSFTIVDTTIPTVAWTGQPAATLYTTQPANFIIGYEDFTAFNPAVANSYVRWRVNAGPYNNYVLFNASFNWGTFNNILTYSIPGNTFNPGDVVDYLGQVTDGNGNIGILGAGSFTVALAPPGVQDPYPIYGYLNLYNGNGGAYTAIPSAGGAIVTATWISSFNGATLTRTDATNALGQFSIDLMNYTDGAQVWLTAPFDAPYNNLGYNYTTINIVGFPGGRMQNVLCGIPYDVEITVPIAGAIEQSGVPFATTYVWYDINGLLCQGYYSFFDGNMIWWSGDPLFVPPAGYQFNGIADAGTHNDLLTLFTGGNQWINISEGGAPEANPWPTPWGAIQIPTTFVGGNVVLVPGFLKDWDNITVMVLAGGFDWKVVDGWNIVSVPQDPVNKGTNLVFDSFDALEYVAWQLTAAGGFTDLSLADRTGGNPSTYNMFDYGMAEGVAFPMDGVHGYWVYANLVLPAPVACHFNSTNYSAGLNVLNAVAGWNLVGFTHNYIAWGAMPTAADWTTAAIDPDLATVGKIVATEWLEDAVPQWYNSYVDMAGFPGMATHNWIWDNGYSQYPGNGLFLWLEAPAQINFNVAF